MAKYNEGREPNFDLIETLAKEDRENEKSQPPEGFSKGICVKHVAIDTKEWGHSAPNEKDNQIVLQEITIPFVDPEKPENKYLIQALTYNFETPRKNEEKQNETLTLVAWGGGGSDAWSLAAYATKLRNAVINNPDFPCDVHLVIMPHLIGQPKTGDFEQSENTIKEAARIEALILQTPELKVTDDIAFIGFSAGGAMATEMVALLQNESNKKIHFAALCDSAGMADIENVLGKVAKNIVVNAFKKFREQGLSVADTIKELMKEFYTGMPTPSGTPRNVLELAHLQNPMDHDQNRYYARLAKEWGFAYNKGAKGLDVKPIETDSTREARENIQCPVVFAPILGSEAVNSLWARLKDGLQSYVSFEELAQIEKDVQENTAETMFGLGNADIRSLEQRELARMFPKTEVFLAADTGRTHSGPFGENGQHYWDNVIKAATNAMKIYD